LRLSSDERRELEEFAKVLMARVGDGRTFSCLITNDRQLQKLNRTFLDHDYPTDVLSFPQNEAGEDLGELAISIERAEAQAREYRHSVLDEMRILMLHGVLHLAGMDHERDRGAMAKREGKLRDEFRLPNSLIARASR
jgi:probable rRNA maturation factor